MWGKSLYSGPSYGTWVRTMVWDEHEDYDDLDTMADPAGYLESGEINDFEEGFIRGFAAA